MIAFATIVLTRLVLHLGLQHIMRHHLALGRIEAAVAALLGGQILQLALMVLLSLGGLLWPTVYTTAYIILAILTGLIGWKVGSPVRSEPKRSIPATTMDRALVAGLATVAGLALYRALFFFDSTYDVLTYALPKLGGYVQHGSVLHLTGLADLRIDANERNGELLFLHSFLIGNDQRWLALGGLEVWLTVASAIAFLARRAGATPRLALGITALVASSPIIFGLSAVTKGDALALAWIVAAAGWLIGPAGPTQLVFFALALAQAVNCKISAAFPGIGLVAVQLWANRHHLRFPPPTACLLGTFAVAICFSKPIQNLFTFGRPFVRTEFERELSGFSWGNLTEALLHFPAPLFGLQADLLPGSFQSDLGKSLGLSAVIALAAVFARLVVGRASAAAPSVSRRRLGLTISGMALGNAAMLSIMPNYDPVLDLHTFRFSTPTIVTVVVIALAAGPHLSAGPLHRSLPAVLLLAAGWHLIANTNPSSTLSHYGRKDLLTRSVHPLPVDARFGYWFQGEPDRVALARLQEAPREVHVYQLEGDSPIGFAFGESFNWRVADITRATDVQSALQSAAATTRTIVVTSRTPVGIAPGDAPDQFPGWRRLIDLSTIDVFERSH